jgi:hypothetical protein
VVVVVVMVTVTVMMMMMMIMTTMMTLLFDPLQKGITKNFLKKNHRHDHC